MVPGRLTVEQICCGRDERLDGCRRPSLVARMALWAWQRQGLKFSVTSEGLLVVPANAVDPADRALLKRLMWEICDVLSERPC